MEDEAIPRRSVAELAGRFKVSVPSQNESEKPVRRRPPRTLQLPKAHGDEPEVSLNIPSPQNCRAKRNSALIEKLQANLVLSPTGSPLKSPGLRVLPLTFNPPSPGSTPSAMTPTSPESSSPITEGPASFEAPPTVVEGNVLLSVNKSRARVSMRRRPPSRHHRMSSSGDEVGGDEDKGSSDMNSPTGRERAEGEAEKEKAAKEEVEPEKETEGANEEQVGVTKEQGGAKEGRQEVFLKEKETEASTLLKEDENHREEKTTSTGDVMEEDKQKSEDTAKEVMREKVKDAEKCSS